MNKITANIITLNEESNIERCVHSVRKVCDEVIVIDSYSNDNTIELARTLGCKVYQKKYLGDGPQKNIASNYAKNNWLLSIDADEILDEELIKSINNLDLEKTEYDSFSFNRKNHIGNQWIKYAGWYPDNLVRLYNIKKCKYEDSEVHAKVFSYRSKKISGNLIHYTYSNYHEMFYKINKYSTRSANMLYKDCKTSGVFNALVHSLWAFFLRYILKLGFMDGVSGFVVSYSIAHGSFLKYIKLRELNKIKPNKSSLSFWKY